MSGRATEDLGKENFRRPRERIEGFRRNSIESLRVKNDRGYDFDLGALITYVLKDVNHLPGHSACFHFTFCLLSCLRSRGLWSSRALSRHKHSDCPTPSRNYELRIKDIDRSLLVRQPDVVISLRPGRDWNVEEFDLLESIPVPSIVFQFSRCWSCTRKDLLRVFPPCSQLLRLTF